MVNIAVTEAVDSWSCFYILHIYFIYESLIPNILYVIGNGLKAL